MTNEIDPLFSRKLFPKIGARPDLRRRRPGIDIQPKTAEKKDEPFDIAVEIMKYYDKLIYEPALPLILKRMPALSRQDLNYQQIKNLTQSRIYQHKDQFMHAYRENNWQIISDILVLYISNTIINKYLTVKSEKMKLQQSIDGLKQYEYGDTTNGYFPVNGQIAEIPFVVSDDDTNLGINL